MAESTRHAAWHEQTSYAVKLLPEPGLQPGLALQLAGGFADFLDAFDFASEWLDEEDPGREGKRCIAIFETRGDVTARVWTYPAGPPEESLVQLFGFDPVRWNPVAEVKAAQYGGRTGRRSRS